MIRYFDSSSVSLIVSASFLKLSTGGAENPSFLPIASKSLNTIGEACKKTKSTESCMYEELRVYCCKSFYWASSAIACSSCCLCTNFMPVGIQELAFVSRGTLMGEVRSRSDFFC